MKTVMAQDMLARARAAQPGWAELPVSMRCEYLARVRREIARQCDSIADLIADECRKHPLDALSGDVLVTLEHLRYCERNAPRVLHPRKIARPQLFFFGARFEVQYEPHGVALIFGPSNYPLQLSLVPLTTALVAGNAAILKCSDRTPETAMLIARICSDAGLPDGLVQVCYERPVEASALIDGRPDFIFFTGSSRNGRQVAQQAAEHLIPGIFELGGKDASIVFADCHIERAIEGITYGAFSNAGRVCVAVKRIYVDASIYSKFVERLTRRMADLQVGCSGAEFDFFPYPANERAELRSQIEDALAHGAKLLWPEDATQVLEKPVILSGVPPNATLLTQESFGPVLCIAPFQNEHEAIRLANSVPFALSSSIWTHDRARARRIVSQLNTGSCAVNDVVRVIANPYAPFGGNGLSGYGRYHGPEGLRAFSRAKTVMTTYTRRTREINWFPFTAKTSRQLAWLLRFRHGSAGLFSRVFQIVLLASFAIALPRSVPAQSRADTPLLIVVDLTPNAHGDLGYLAFASSDGFPGDRDKALRHGFSPIPLGAKQMKITLDLPAGTYAVSLYEDLNGNHKLDHNWIGIPGEPVGVSNNPASNSGAPKFGDSLFHMAADPQTITIHMVRP
jgi:4,4'-diapolycopenoate synthase